MTTVGRWSPNKVRARVLDGTWVSPEELGGMVLLTPTSVDITGGGSETATTLANGSVEFLACETLSLNGVFSADYDNYMVAVRAVSSASSIVRVRLRENGSDANTTNYTDQYLAVNNTSISAARGTSQTGAYLMWGDTAQRYGVSLNLYGPYLTQPTAFRSVTADSYQGAEISDAASTHSLATQYDGLTVYPSSGNFTGLVSVYGLVGA